MNKYRLSFEKSGRAKYISHLDLMRTFQRAFQRAKVPIKHTEGFNPHAHISIALPLSVGMESVCELLDFETEADLGADVVTSFNAVMPEGIIIKELTNNTRKVGEIAWLRCEIRLTYDNGVPEGAEEKLSALFKSDSLVIRKKSKKGEVDFDLIPCINALKVARLSDKQLLIDAIVAAQNPSLNPMHLIDAVKKYLPETAPDFAAAKRLELFDGVLTSF